MKKSLIVLLIMVLACSFAFAEPVETMYTNAFNSYASELKDSVDLSGKLTASYDYDFLTSTGSFGKKAKFAYFDLNATKVFSTGAGSAKGEGAIYAAVDAELTFSWDFAATVDGFDPWDGSSSIKGDNWKTTNFLNFGVGTTTVGGGVYAETSFDALTMKLAITDAYIAKDGAWKLNLMKSDTGLDYAKSALSTMNEYYNYGSYNLEDTKKVALSMLNPVTKHTGVILTTEGNPYLAEVSFGMDGKDYSTGSTKKGLFNLLVKSQEVAVDNVTISAGALIGTADTYNKYEADTFVTLDKDDDGKITGTTEKTEDVDAEDVGSWYAKGDVKPEVYDGKVKDSLKSSALDFAAGLKIAYADDVVTADAAADFLVADLENTKKFDADVAFNFAAAGVKFNFYYATNANYKADTDYTLYKGMAGTSDYTTDFVLVPLTKYAEAKLAYAFNYADVDFELGVKGTDLNYASRKFSFVGTASNDVFTFGAEIGYVAGEANVTEVRKAETEAAYSKAGKAATADDYKVSPKVTGDFDLTYTADLFNVAADFEFSHKLNADTSDWGLALKIQSDKIVDGANFGLKYTRATAGLFDIVDIVDDGVSKITAFAEIAF